MKNNITQRPVAPQDLSTLAKESDFVSAHLRGILALVFAVHVVATVFFFPLGDIFNPKPVLTLDHAFHYYQVHRAGEVFWQTGKLHAYDPYFMGGYPSTIFDLDVKGAELFCSPFRGDSSAVAFKLFILICYLSIVFTVYKGCRYLGWKQREAVFALLVFLVFWHWGRPYASHFRYAGMFEFIFASHLAILVAGLFNRFLSGRNTLWFFVLGTLIFFIHPTAVVILDVPFAVLVIFQRRPLTVRRVFLFVVWCLCVVLVNAVWVIPFFEYAGIKAPSNTFFQTAGLSGVFAVLFRPGCLPAVVMLVLAPLGLWRLHKGGRGVGAWALASTAVFLLFISAYGVRIPGVRHLEPGRFLLPALFFAAPPAGAGVLWMMDIVLSRLPRPKLRRGTEASVVGLALVASLCGAYLAARTGYHHRLFTTPSSEVQELLEALSSHLDSSARLMIEDGPAALYDEVHLPGILPTLTGVEQIGGPYPYTFIAHHFATFQTDYTMGRPLASFSAGEFREYLDLYNVGWVVTASPDGHDTVVRLLKAAGDSDTGGEIVWSSARYTLWRLNRPRSFTENPDDRVRARYNRIEIELAAVPDRFLLRYHWDRGIEVSPPAVLVKELVLDDPVPFILVDPNGASSIVIKY